MRAESIPFISQFGTGTTVVPHEAAAGIFFMA